MDWHIFLRMKVMIDNQGRADKIWGPVPNYKMGPYLLIDKIIVIIINSTYISCKCINLLEHDK
jgi:hypothetical protein